MLITDLAATLTFVELCEEVRMLCSVAKQQPITLKWIDDEGDPCTISSQMELEEALRIYNRTKRSGLLLHVFPSIPEQPGMPCPGEDKGERWRVLKSRMMRSEQAALPCTGFTTTKHRPSTLGPTLYFPLPLPPIFTQHPPLFLSAVWHRCLSREEPT
ncbi:hypothetical protein JOQ06_006760, partial [Pogonophryne albipinna]